MEIAIRWSTTSTPADPRFLIADVTGRTFKHCRVTNGKTPSLRWTELSRNSKAPAFRAFDWAPQHGVVAVGQWSGETTVLGLDSSAPQLPLPVKSQRQCNAVAFNRDALLATGLEKIRNDFCLNVYDVQHWLGDRGGVGLRAPTSEPARKLASSEGIVSIKFFPHAPHVLACGVKGSAVRVYDLRDSSGAPALQYATACVHNLAVDPCDPNYFASAAPVRDATVHVWDRRAPQRPVTGTSAPADGAVLQLTDLFQGGGGSGGEAAQIWSLKYSPAESGCLGVLGSGGNFRIFQTKRDYVELARGGAATISSDEASQRLYVHSTETVGRALPPQLQSRSKERPADGERPILAFDFMNVLMADRRPGAITLRGNQDVGVHRLRPAPPVLASSTLHEVVSAPPRKTKAMRNNVYGLDYWWRPGGDQVSADLKIRCRNALGPLLNGTPVTPLPEIAPDPLAIDDGWNDLPQEPAKLPARSLTVDPAHIHLGEALVFADTTRRRCREGYLFDAEKNLAIVEEDPALCALWTWLGRAASNAANDGMATDSIDFAYLGLYHLWQGQLGARAEPRRSTTTVTVAAALQTLAAQLELWDVDFPATSRPAARKLCLHAAGFATDPDAMLAQVKPLALAGKGLEGAFCALIGDDWQLAMTALRSGPRAAQHRALASVIALFGEREAPDRIQRQAELVGDDRRVLVRAIVAYVSRTALAPDVAAQLPPSYRAALAVKLLSDQDLTAFLTERRDAAIKDGDVAGVLYTGLSGEALHLFARFVERTADVQSAVLALAHVCPRFVPSQRVQQWRGAYRDLLNSWRLFLPRAQFDMQSTQLSLRHGQPTLQPSARQVTLRCLNCDGPLHREPHGAGHAGALHGADASAPHRASLGASASAASSQAALPLAPAAGTKAPVNVLGAKDGTRCPRCGAGLPRCVVCDHRVGIVDPLTKGGAELERRRAERLGGTAAPRDGRGGPRDGPEGDRSERGEEPGVGLGLGIGVVVDAAKENGREDPFAEFTEVCLGCRHVYHRGHAAAWFARHAVCAAVGCACLCGTVDGK